MKSSQPYVLGSILTDSFFSGDSNIDFSLIRIYPQLYNLLNDIVSNPTSGVISEIEKSIYNNKRAASSEAALLFI